MKTDAGVRPFSGEEASAGSGPGSGTADERPRHPVTTWLPLLVVATFPYVVVYRKLGGLRDPDAFWHILGGQHFAETHDVVFDDPYGQFSSYQWVQLDWLSDLAMAAAYAVAGLAGVAWIFTAGAILLFVVLFYACRQRAGLVSAAFVALVGWIGASASLSERSQVFSFVLLAITIIAWHRTTTDGAPRWWLVPLTWVWACIHGYWFMGPAVGAVVLLGLVLDKRRPLRTVRLALVPALSVVAAALTPLGLRVLAAPFNVNSYAQYVSEYHPPDVHDAYVIATLALLVGTVVGWVRSARAPSWADLLLWLMALGWALLYARTVALGAVLAAPLAAAQLQALVGKPREPFSRIQHRVVAASAFAAVVVAAILGPIIAPGPAAKPTGLDSALEALPPSTVVMNSDGLGGWLLLMHPHVEPVIDTRTYLFSHEYIESYSGARRTTPGWQQFLERTGATAALLPSDESLTAALQDQLAWRVVGSDEEYTLLVSPN